MKTCSACRVEKPLGEFRASSSNKDGLLGKCHACEAEYQREYRSRNKAAVKAKGAARRKASPEKEKARVSAWVKANPEKAKESQRRRNARFNAKNPYHTWAPERVERHKAHGAVWRRVNKPKRAEAAMRRYAAEKRATPPWANRFFIQEAYALAELRSKMLGFLWHVDHVVPLRGELVCGLHAEANLQVIPAVVNHAKNNKFEVA